MIIIHNPSLVSSKIAALFSLRSLRASSASSIEYISLPAAEEDAIFGDFGCDSGGLGLRDGSRALRVEVGAIFGDGVRERDDEADE